MGCLVSKGDVFGGARRKPKSIGEIAVYVPGMRIPKPIDFTQAVGDGLSKSMVERLTALRTRIVVMAGQEEPMATKSRRTATQHGGSSLADLQQALEDYLPVLMGLVENGNQSKLRLQFSWVNQEDETEETTMSNSWYEVLSVLHLMGTISLSQANLLLLPKTSTDLYPHKTFEECKRDSVNVFLKAAGYLDFAIQNVLPRLPDELRKDLPLDLKEGALRALSMQALGQGVEIQLGIALDSIKASLAVKRRLACEMVKYWHMAHDNITNLPVTNGWGEKHKLFINWKYAEAKAIAYYLHGLILDEGNTERLTEMAVAALKEAEKSLQESKRTCESFHKMPPLSRNPVPWGTSAYLAERIPKDISSRTINLDQNNGENSRTKQTAPTLPDFALSLQPDEYQLPSVDPSWKQ